MRPLPADKLRFDACMEIRQAEIRHVVLHYRSPVPHRGRRNEPAFLPHVAEALARVRGVSVGHVGVSITYGIVMGLAASVGSLVPLFPMEGAAFRTEVEGFLAR